MIFLKLLGVVILLYLLYLPHIILATQTYIQSSTLVSTNFNSNYSGWAAENRPSTWSISSGNLLALNTSRSQGDYMKYSGGNWDNISIDVDINSNGGIDEGVAFRRSDASNFYEVNLRHGTGSYDTPEIKLIKFQGGVQSTLVSTRSTPLVNNTWYHLKIEAYQTHIQVWLNSNLIFEVDDPGSTVTSGSVALSYWTGVYGMSIVRFDNIAINSITLPTPTPTPTSTPTPSPSPTPTPEPTPTSAPTPSPTPEPTSAPTPTVTPTPTLTPTPTPTSSPVSTSSNSNPGPTSTPTPQPTSTPTPTIFRPRTRPTPLPTIWPTPTIVEILPSPTAAVLGLTTEITPVASQTKKESNLYLILVLGAFLLLLAGTITVATLRKSKKSND